ncbi:hypothetical protein A3A76_04570 [Candidatus Woesebacteria bacterium RIFCSPLOWO2_01_FULL_39_23]|uniref:7 transmembrane helices usually fused to an inactive transglutaminase domain-containing protein n=1 Tax=Candidatus Woesebacteria bacterium RIFCSPHIGHO2_01_FULL_40_22 TaxID=1802499 RepID=A0A1F7YK48_9BACT|nr:MAG: hypothetical protein A2628_04205 [Candidatus Woesebacteria bacterium RIFCSPHIGHO2_01_FULL_40_22]OGM37040.1 MAG: hypothetical protein A3E41_01155 [Candidatus Woesebacteria bacterium RIFCSPHIGHO2_12_FULL_38_9]OGM63475.1 MAG: hypothetical protein A3A76_04570 [Candidatus Woesebacteria bacterium RIFCSPLOWO2_01_FULL_39_23]
MKKFLISILIVCVMASIPVGVFAAKITPTASPSATLAPTATETPVPTLVPRADLTQKSEETVEPLRKILNDQQLGSVLPFNFIKFAIRYSVESGVPANTIVLVLLLPLVAAAIAFSRHIIGIRGFGIFLPVALSVVFLATGPVVGIGLFLVIVASSTLTRMVLRKLRIKLQYLPRMAIIFWVVSVFVLGILFSVPMINYAPIMNVSIFAVLILALLTEDFIRVQLGKSVKTAIDLTSETLILSLISYLILTLKPVQKFALLNPEILLSGVLFIDLLLGKYVGLRIMEIWRFRKLIKS